MIGQVNYEDNELGQYIVDISSKETVKTIVEVGPWNGLGTTRCVFRGLLEKKDYEFYSIESSDIQYIQAVHNNCHNINKSVHFLYGKLVNEDLLTSWIDIQTLNSEQLGWLEQDRNWMSRVPNVVDKLPIQIDFLILDGGEFSTYLEWTLLKDRIKYLALDDTTQLKCSKIREEILNSKDFNIIKDAPNGSKYGFLIAEKV